MPQSVGALSEQVLDLCCRQAPVHRREAVEVQQEDVCVGLGVQLQQCGQAGAEVGARNPRMAADAAERGNEVVG